MMPQTAETPKTDKWFAHLPPNPEAVIPLKGDKNKFTAQNAVNEFTYLGEAFTFFQKESPSLPEIESLLKTYIRIGKCLGVDASVYLSETRERFFAKTGNFIQWAKGVTDYEERYLYVLLGVGDMLRNLGEVYYNRHKETDIVRLEIAASIPDERRQKAFLTRADFHTLSRDELRAEAAKLRGIAGREEHAAKTAKKPGVQLDFFSVLDGAAAQTFTPEALTTAAAQVEPLTLLKASQSVLALLDEAAAIGRLANVAQITRRGFAAALRAAAAKLDY